jgi:hypothetical protein
MSTRRWRAWLIEPRVRGLDPDAPGVTLAHRQVVLHKHMLRVLFEGFYRECRAADQQLFGHCPGRRVEIGSGSSFIKQLFPDIITSDIKRLPFTDVVFRAEQMPFADNSLRAIYGINVFHHLPAPRVFFHEAQRVLHTRGGIVLIEPYCSTLGGWLFPRLHAAERFDPTASGWNTAAARGPASGANQALSYIVFTRDRAQFEREFPQLEIVLDRPHTHLLYLLSGGVNFRQLVPDRATTLVQVLQALLAPANRWIALQHTIVLRKRADADVRRHSAT